MIASIPSRVDTQRWLYVDSVHLRLKREDATEKSPKKNSQDTPSQDSLNRPKSSSTQLTQDASNNDLNLCSQKDVSSQYSQGTISKIFDETSSQFSEEVNHDAPEETSSQYSQETISKIFEDSPFEAFEQPPTVRKDVELSPPSSRPAKRRRSSVEPRNENSEKAYQRIINKIFDDDSSGNSNNSAGFNFLCTTNSDDSSDSDYDDEYVPRLKWKTTTTVGKWLLFNDTAVSPVDKLSAHDRAWDTIKFIVMDANNRDIMSAKCSTNYSCRYSEYASSSGVICCYTRDYRDKLSVKRAGDAIRNALGFTCCIYYKTDDATSAGAYQHLGNTSISMYMHTNGNKMYERGDNGKWTLFSC